MTNVVVLFLSYRIIIANLGIEGLGIWSLLISLFSITSLGNAGIASGTVKFIAEYKAQNESQSLLDVVFNSLLIVLAFTLLLLGIIYSILESLPLQIISQEEKKLITPVIPLIATSYLLAIVGRIFLSVLDGLNLIYLRSIIGIISKGIFLITVLLVTESFGLFGLAAANLIQYLVILILAVYHCAGRLNFHFKNFGMYNKRIFREILNYGMQFQLSSVFQMIMDPLIKFFLKDLGGNADVGKFEVVYKIYGQIRQLIVVVVVIYVPQVAALNKKSKEKIIPLFTRVTSDVLLMSVIFFSAAFCFLPVFLILLGVTYSREIQEFSILVYLGLMFNIIGVVSYYFNAGTGDLRGNTISSLLMGLLNTGLCLFFGYALSLGSIGIMLSWVFAQLLANSFLVVSFNKNHGMRVQLSRETLLIISINVAYLLFSSGVNALFDYMTFTAFVVNLSLLICYFVFVFKMEDRLNTYVKMAKSFVING